MDIDDIKIDNDIPVPVGSDRRSGERKYPLKLLNVGDSFFIPLEEQKNFLQESFFHDFLGKIISIIMVMTQRILNTAI